MYEGIIYFASPRSRWLGKAHPDDVITRVTTPWRWLTRFHLLNVFSSLDANRCGWAVLEDGGCIEQYDPPLEGA